MRKLFFYLALLTIFVTSSWGACTTGNYRVSLNGQWCKGPSHPDLSDCSSSSRPCTESCAGEYCVNSISRNGYYYIDRISDTNYENYCVGSGSFLGNTMYGTFAIRCNTKAEADSIACEQEGGQWDGTSCVQGDTTSCETYKAVCEKAGGKFTGAPLGNGCNAYCELCDSPIFKEKIKAFGNSCCSQDLIPPDSSENLLCYDVLTQGGQGMASSQTCLADNSCVCGSPYNEETGEFNMVLYGEKCGAAEGSPNPSSSGSGSGENSSSSAAEDSSNIPKVQVMGLEGLMDSLHKIIYNTAEVDTTTQYMLMCMQNPELYCPSLIEDGDTTIVEGDTTIVNVEVPSDSAVIAEVSENVKNQGARTRNKLDSMQKAMIEEMQASDSARRYFDSSANHYRDSLLGIIGAEQIVEGNQTQALLDSVKGKLEGVIGELAGLGNKFDSMSLDLPDTTLDLGGKDTTRIMGTIDSLGTWVGTLISPDSAGGWGTPNVGGGYGDGSGYGFGLGQGSNDSAVGAYGRELKGLVSDTGAIGNILDTMSSWTEKFDFGAVASTGGCPSFLEKTYQINIAGVTFTMGSIGQYLCTPLAGIRTTMWDIGRMVLRAIVSIMCFLWLFRICTNEGKED